MDILAKWFVELHWINQSIIIFWVFFCIANIGSN